MGCFSLALPPLYQYIYELSLALEQQVESPVLPSQSYSIPPLSCLKTVLLPAWEAAHPLQLYCTRLSISVAIV
jgi:hypothetical protein